MASVAELATLIGAATAAVSALAASRSGGRASKSDAAAKNSATMLAAQEATLAGLRQLADDLQEQVELERGRREIAEQQRDEAEAELRRLRRRPRKG